jgi:hypothetical protein
MRSRGQKRYVSFLKTGLAGETESFLFGEQQKFSTIFNSRHTEQGAKIVMAHHQFF